MTIKRTLAGVLTLGLLTAAGTTSTYAFSISDIFGASKKAPTAIEGQKSYNESERGQKNKGSKDRKNKSEKGLGAGMGMMGGMMQQDTKMSTEMQALMEEMRTARENGDSAKITELQTKMKAQRTSDQAKHETDMNTAITGGYETWKKYVTDNKLMPGLTDKITAANFATFVELHTAQQKVRELSEKLGVSDGMPGMGGLMMHDRTK